MTWRWKPTSLGCFEDDAYPYHVTKQKITFLNDAAQHCVVDPGDPAIVLKRAR